MLSSRTGHNDATQDLDMLTLLTSHKVVRNTLVKRMPSLKRNLLLWPAGPERGLYAGMATVDLDRRSPCDWRRLDTRPEYSNVKNKTVEVGGG